MNKISKDMLIGEIIKKDMQTAPILMNAGMHCLGCPSAQVETLAEACSVHDVDVDKLVDELNAYFQEK